MAHLIPILQGRPLHIALLLLVLVLFGLHARNQYVVTHSAGSHLAENIPPEGIADNDTHGRVPGDPDNAVRQLKQIYHYIGIYRAQYPSRPSPEMIDLIRDIGASPQRYGVYTSDAWSLFMNPDSKYSDASNERDHPDQVVPYVMTTKRFDGTAVGTTKQPGTRDVLAWTDIYVHQNLRTFKGDRTTINPVGVYVVLWDDGQVEKLPLNQVMNVPQGPGNYMMAFRGQAGLLPGSLTYDQFNEKYPTTFAKK